MGVHYFYTLISLVTPFTQSLNFSLLRGVHFHSMSMVDLKNVRQHDVKWVFNTTKDINMMNNNFLCIF